MSSKKNGDMPISAGASADSVGSSGCATNVVIPAVAPVESDSQVPSITRIARPRPSASVHLAVGNLVARREGWHVSVLLIALSMWSLIYLGVLDDVIECV